ncbi:unnamed protein product [Trichogramma brassicae]|uniref:Uncharacterized protein n=1 Tax=Trichogramma brassicae TaxID=86971 RepID=A0A6H5J9S0_9HYME|nr:unnamed protein product [Trichogramma brassicae]
MPPSRLDAVYRSILLTKFFTKGWGEPENLRRIFKFRKVVANREACYSLIPKNYPVKITKDEEWSDCHIVEGQFESPFEKNLPGIMPEETKTAHFQMVLPKHWESQKIKPICLHLAGTGDHYFWRRRTLVAKPLLKETGIASILLENPFYGLRKPKDQVRSSLHNVSDIFIMGGCLIMESIVILNWLEQHGYGPLGLTGLSMGGHMASLAATNWPNQYPYASINWALLESQFFENEAYQNDLAKMVKVVDQDDAFLAGQHFAKHFPASMKRLNKIKTESNSNVNNNNSNGTVAMPNGTYLTNGNGNGIDTQQCSEEKEAAKLFPLNLITNKFKSAQTSDILKDEKWRERAALQFMRGIMDECTHLQNFEKPVDTELIIAVCARDDAYVPRDDVVGLEKIWPGAEIRFLDAGHVSAYLLYQKLFRSTIDEAFQRYLKKYPMNTS